MTNAMKGTIPLQTGKPETKQRKMSVQIHICPILWSDDTQAWSEIQPTKA